MKKLIAEEDISNMLEQFLIKKGMTVKKEPPVPSFNFDINNFTILLQKIISDEAQILEFIGLIKTNDYRFNPSEIKKINKINSVVERLELTNKLIDSGIEVWGLVVYLSLTCFDTLGQPEEYKTFDVWIKSYQGNASNEISSENIREKIIQLFHEYQSEYGVKNSFFNFLRRMKNEPSYEKVLMSINPDRAIKLDMEENLVLNNFREAWMYSYRNSFTHRSRNCNFDIFQGENSIAILEPITFSGNKYHVYIEDGIIIKNLNECIVVGIKKSIDELLKKRN